MFTSVSSPLSYFGGMCDPLAALVPGLSSSTQALLNAIDDICTAVQRGRADLEAERQRFRAIAAEVEALNALQDQVQQLDVGGTPFHVARSSLMSHGDHFLSVLTSSPFAPEEDESHYAFIDRDPRWFGAVLSYLREERLDIPRSRDDRLALGREARYYLLKELHDATQEEECIVVVGRGMVQMYHPLTGAWHAMRSEGLAPVAAARVGRELYVVNRGAAGHPGDLMRLCRLTGRIERVGALPTSLHLQMAAGVGDHFVLFGFAASGPRRLQVNAFDTRRSVWEAWGDLERLRQKFATCVLDGRLVVLGGRDMESNPLRTVEEYWPHSPPHWRPLAAMLEKRSRPAAVVWNRKLVVVGGYNNESGSLSSAEEYDPATRTWTALPNMRSPRIGCRAVVLEGHLVVLGGLATGIDTEFKTVERYDPRDRRWHPMPSMCEAPVDPWAAVLSVPSHVLPDPT